MPKRKKLSLVAIFGGEASGTDKRGLLRRLTTWKAREEPSKKLQRASMTQQAMRTRRMSVEAAMEDISVDFARKASIHPSTADEPPRKSGPNPAALAPPHIVGPVKGRSHNGTLVLLHGFTCNGPDLAEELLPQLKDRLEGRQYNGLRFVFLTAPLRQVSCYGDPRPEHTAWHDYWSDHGGSEGRPDLEEDIDQGQLEWSKAQVHQIIDAEAELLGGDHSRVAILGQSQGSCTALHCALTYPHKPAGILCSIGQLYSFTPVPDDRKDLPIFTYNGAADDCIACCLSLRTYSRLLEAGYTRLRMRVQPEVGHEGSTAEEADLLCEALEAWGLLKPPKKR